MSSAVAEMPGLIEGEARPPMRAVGTGVGAGLVLCLLLAITQVAIGGYQLGVGNQAIQITFLKHLSNPALFATDNMVQETLPTYPSYFFRLLALPVRLVGVEPL